MLRQLFGAKECFVALTHLLLPGARCDVSSHTVIDVGKLFSFFLSFPPMNTSFSDKARGLVSRFPSVTALLTPVQSAPSEGVRTPTYRIKFILLPSPSLLSPIPLKGARLRPYSLLPASHFLSSSLPHTSHLADFGENSPFLFPR